MTVPQAWHVKKKIGGSHVKGGGLGGVRGCNSCKEGTSSRKGG